MNSMCGRVTLVIDLETLQEILIDKYRVPKPHINPYNPRYNITPGQNLLTVINDGSNNRAGYLSWGFVPPWAKDTKIGYKMINARAETIDEKPAFKASFKSKRCIYLVDSYYEWRTTDNSKVPFRVMPAYEGLLPLAGLYTTCKLPDGQIHHSGTIITTEANTLIKPIHHRMPVILANDAIEDWLNTKFDDTTILKTFLTPYEPNQLMLYEVSKLVNNGKIDSPECIAPVKS